MNREEIAVARKHNGYNCCQAVLLAFADRLDMDEETLAKLGAAFGAGMGGFQATCGALCGTQMLLGLLKSLPGKPVMHDAKAFADAFRALSGALSCGELKGIETGRVLCSCDDCVRHAVRIAEENLPL